MEEILWTSKNGKWRIMWIPVARTAKGEIRVDNLQAKWETFPVMYWDTQVGWDKPWLIPQYVQNKTQEVMFQMVRAGRLT